MYPVGNFLLSELSPPQTMEHRRDQGSLRDAGKGGLDPTQGDSQGLPVPFSSAWVLIFLSGPQEWAVFCFWQGKKELPVPEDM